MTGSMILTGKDKKKTDVVEKIIGDRVMLRSLNAYKKHQRGNPNANKPGGIITKHLSLHISNVVPVNPETNKAEKISYKKDDKGKKVRFFKSNSKEL